MTFEEWWEHYPDSLGLHPTHIDHDCWVGGYGQAIVDIMEYFGEHEKLESFINQKGLKKIKLEDGGYWIYSLQD